MRDARFSPRYAMSSPEDTKEGNQLDVGRLTGPAESLQASETKASVARARDGTPFHYTTTAELVANRGDRWTFGIRERDVKEAEEKTVREAKRWLKIWNVIRKLHYWVRMQNALLIVPAWPLLLACETMRPPSTVIQRKRDNNAIRRYGLHTSLAVGNDHPKSPQQVSFCSATANRSPTRLNGDF